MIIIVTFILIIVISGCTRLLVVGLQPGWGVTNLQEAKPPFQPTPLSSLLLLPCNTTHAHHHHHHYHWRHHWHRDCRHQNWQNRWSLLPIKKTLQNTVDLVDLKTKRVNFCRVWQFYLSLAIFDTFHHPDMVITSPPTKTKCGACTCDAVAYNPATNSQGPRYLFQHS